MIKLDRFESPAYLSDEKQYELIEKYKTDGSSVWNVDAIKGPLLKSSFGKCAYCECDLTEESKYMEVEHFEDKKNNPNKVVVWVNLLPSCKKCNGSKGTHDVVKEPIVNPYDDDPTDHLSLRLFRMRGLTEKGENIIDVVGLNNSERLVLKRFEIGNKISECVEECWIRYDKFNKKPNTRSRNRLIFLVEGLFNECQPKSIYAATSATVALTDDKFTELISTMKNNELWPEYLEKLLVKTKSLVLKCV